MDDLEQRLGEYYRSEPADADARARLISVIADPRARRPRWAIPIAVAATVLVAAIVSLLLSRPREDVVPIGPPMNFVATPTIAPIEAAPPAPATMIRDGSTFRVTAVSPQAARRNGTSLQIVAFRAYNKKDPRCSTLSPTVQVVREDADSVVVAAFAYRSPQRSSSRSMTCLYATSGQESLYARLSVRLSQPLGDRTVFDAKTGKPIAFLDDLVPPTPSYVPAGYVAVPPIPQGLGDETLQVRQYRHGDDSLEIRARSITAWGLSGRTLGSTTVHGHPAVLTEESYERCVTWTPKAGVIVEVCSLGQHSYLSSEELVKIANST